jgi:hypothetical protein
MNSERGLALAAATVAMFVALITIPALFEGREAGTEIEAIELDRNYLLGPRPDRARIRGVEAASNPPREGAEPGHRPNPRTRVAVAGRAPKAGAGNGPPMGTAQAPSGAAISVDARGAPSNAGGASVESGQPPVEDTPPAEEPPLPPPEQPSPLVVAPPPADVEVQAANDDDDDAEAGLEPADGDIEGGSKGGST